MMNPKSGARSSAAASLIVKPKRFHSTRCGAFFSANTATHDLTKMTRHSQGRGLAERRRTPRVLTLKCGYLLTL
jgi:hypothetical protein